MFTSISFHFGQCQRAIFSHDMKSPANCAQLFVVNGNKRPIWHEFHNGVKPNRFSIHFGEDKTTATLFASKRKIKKVPKLSITYKRMQIKQYSKVTYLGSILDDTMSREVMATKVINKINSRLKFLPRKNKFLTPALRRLLCNALIKTHFDYASSAWYPNLTQKIKNKIQITQNKCIRYCLQLNDPYFQKWVWNSKLVTC